MPEAARLTYTVTPGPEVLAKMGTSWTLFASPPVMFTVGPDGEPPEPATVTMTAEQAADLASSGYVVEEPLSAAPEPVNDVQVSPGLEGVESEPVNDVRVATEELSRESLERALDRTLTPAEAEAVGLQDSPVSVTYTAGDGEERTEAVEGMPLPGGFAVRDSVAIGAAENMPGEPGEGVQVEPGTQADGSPTEPVKRRKT